VSTIYRKCKCGETAHDYKYQSARELNATHGRGVWACRNCGALAKDRRGQIKFRAGYAREAHTHDHGVGGDDPQTDKG
jgi:hypothetical protein